MSSSQRPPVGYVGQVRFHVEEGWVDVSEGLTRRDAAAGAALAYRNHHDSGGRSPCAVRVIVAAHPTE